MKLFRWVGLLLLAGSLRLAAQVSVEISVSQEEYLLGEDLLATVRISNESGQTLVLGQDDEWLDFFIDAKDRTMVLRQGKVPVKGPFTIGSSQVAKKRVNLQPYFRLSNQGNYRVVATVKIPGWQARVMSQPATFSIVKGRTIWEEEFGVPLPPSVANRLPEVRKYALLQATYLKNLRLYLRITDQSGNGLIKLLNLGPFMSFGDPEVQLDKFSNLHILHQVWARTFHYNVVNPDGQLIAHETHDMSQTRPRLLKTDKGHIVVVGGARKLSDDDVPPPMPPPEPPAPLPAPPTTNALPPATH